MPYEMAQQQQQQQKTTVWASVKVLVYVRVSVFTCVWISSFGVVHITLSGIRTHSPHFHTDQTTNVQRKYNLLYWKYQCALIHLHRSDVRLLLYSFSLHSMRLLLLFVIFVIDFVFFVIIFFLARAYTFHMILW